MIGFSDLIDGLRASWGPDTSGGPGKHGCPHGQCAVTALVVQDYLGGALLRCELKDAAGVACGSHYWNLIPAVGEIDLTRDQFPADYPIPRGEEVPRSRLLEGERAIAARTPERYALLKKRVHDDIRSNVDPEW